LDITWLGHACIRIRTRDAAVLCDPVDKSSGYDMARPTADIVTVSRHIPLHGHLAGVKGESIVIDGPGEYEIRGIQIQGIATALRAPEGSEPGRNISFMLTAEDLHVAHLGGIGSPPTAEQTELLSNADVLIVPIGDGGALTADEAARTVRALEPRVIIPVCYHPGAEPDLLKAFLTAVGIAAEPPVARLSIQARALGDKRQVLLLEPRGG